MSDRSVRWRPLEYKPTSPSITAHFSLRRRIHYTKSNGRRTVRTERVLEADDRFRKAGYAAIDQICDYYTSLQERDVKSSVKPGYLLEQLSSMSSALS